MRTSVRRITASSQTTTGTTRTTCSSPSTTPMTTLTHCTCTSTDAWRTCTDLALRIFHSSWWHRTPHGSSSESIHSHPRSYSWRVLFDSTSPFFLYHFFLPFSVFFLYPDLFLELDNPIVMESLRYSAAEESENTMNVFHSHTSGESMGSSAQREKISLCGELEVRKRLRHESQVRTSQEIEELRRICHEETNQVRKLKIEELPLRQEWDPTTASQRLTVIQDF